MNYFNWDPVFAIYANQPMNCLDILCYFGEKVYYLHVFMYASKYIFS